LSNLNNIKDIHSRKLFPGQSARIGGFKELPDAGFPLYKASDSSQAKFISKQRLRRHEAILLKTKSRESTAKSKVKLDRLEKRRLYSGDTFGLKAQLNVLDEDDLQKMKKQVDKENREKSNVTKFRLGKAKRREARTQRLMDMIDEQEENEEATGIEGEVENKQLLAEMLGLREDVHQPIIVKASSSGALETCLKEVNKTIMHSTRISIINSGIGPVSESDITSAEVSGAYIFSFDVPISDPVKMKAQVCGVLGRSFKLIFKMTDILKDLVDDLEAVGNSDSMVQEAARATVQQIFTIKQKTGEDVIIAGLSVKSGEINKDLS